MVPVLLAVVVLVGVVAVLDLVLTVGVIRRLREHTELLSSVRGLGGPPIAEIGQEIGEFTTVTVAGIPIDRNGLAGETLVGFFTPQCAPCKERLPGFVELARSVSGGPARVLATVVGDGAEVADMVAALRPVAQVVTEPRGGPVSTAFNVGAFPTVVKVAPDSDGRLLIADNQVAVESHGALVA